MAPPVRLWPPVEPAGDGVRAVTRCADGCGAPVVVLPSHVTAGARCATCGREHWGAPVPQRPPPGETRRNGLPLGQPGRGWPAAVRVSTGEVSLRKTRVVESAEVDVDDARVCEQARAVAARTAGARLLWSRARRADSPVTAAGKASANWTKVDEWLSVQWRRDGRTVMAFWRNGQRADAMVGGRVTTHTEVGAL